jgi:pimeloyl-ACP methyl ester carboxylesterase
VDRLVSEALAPGSGSLGTGLGLLRDLDLRDALPRILVPALVIHGSGDRIIPVAAARWLAQHMRTARLVIVPDAGHDLPVRAPNTVALAIGAWVESLAPTGQP